MTLCNSRKAGNWIAACGARGKNLFDEHTEVKATIGKRKVFMYNNIVDAQ